jgi:hypothetical protein
MFNSNNKNLLLAFSSGVLASLSISWSLCKLNRLYKTKNKNNKSNESKSTSEITPDVQL